MTIFPVRNSIFLLIFIILLYIGSYFIFFVLGTKYYRVVSARQENGREYTVSSLISPDYRLNFGGPPKLIEFIYFPLNMLWKFNLPKDELEINTDTFKAETLYPSSK